jgi:hypothetical protein
MVQLAKEILPRLFKHDKLSSLGRQLNVSDLLFRESRSSFSRYMAFRECFQEDSSRMPKAMSLTLQSGVVGPYTYAILTLRPDSDPHVYPHRGT